MQGYVGEVRLFAGNYAPVDWFLCQGQLLATSSYPVLFSIIGALYGGDGSSTFALPDLRGRTPLGTGSGPGLTTRLLGQREGQESVALVLPEIPAHSHAATASVKQPVNNTSAATEEPNNAVPGNNGAAAYASDSDGTFLDPAQVDVSVGSTGSGLAHNNMQPFTAMNYIICWNGTWPARSSVEEEKKVAK